MAFVVLSLVAAGCSGSEAGDERIAETRAELLNIGSTVDVTASSPNGLVGNEAAAVAVPMTSTDSVVFVSYNSNHGIPLGDNKFTHCGWAKSDTAHGTFQSWDSYLVTPGRPPSVRSAPGRS